MNDWWKWKESQKKKENLYWNENSEIKWLNEDKKKKGKRTGSNKEKEK